MYSVLYVDDESSLLEIGKMFLESMEEFSVDTVISASGALPVLQNRNFDAIISDYQMPGMDGIEFLRQVRSSGNDIPFILFTGRGREEIVIKALNEGADFYLQKGGDPTSQFAELAHKIRLSVQRRRAVLALEESERRYREVVETQTEFISRFLPDGTHIFVNEAYCRYFGKDRQQIVGHRFIPTVPQDDWERVRRHFSSLTPDHPSGEIEHRVILQDGAVRWQWWSDHAIFDRSGRVIEYQSVGKDITDRKRAEEALMMSENLYRTIFDFTGAASIITGPDTTILRANDGWEKITGVPRHEQENKLSWTVFFADEDLARMKQYHFSRRKDPAGVPNVYESRMVDSTGAIHTVIVNVGMIPGTENSVASLVDITERRRAEDELRAAYEQITASEEELRAQFEELTNTERMFRHIIENMQDGYIRADMQGVITMVNPAAARMFGYNSAEEMRGVDAKTLYLHPGDRDTLLQALRESGDITNFSGDTVRKDGTTFPVSLNIQFLRNENGLVMGTEAIVREMS